MCSISYTKKLNGLFSPPKASQRCRHLIFLCMHVCIVNIVTYCYPPKTFMPLISLVLCKSVKIFHLIFVRLCHVQVRAPVLYQTTLSVFKRSGSFNIVKRLYMSILSINTSCVGHCRYFSLSSPCKLYHKQAKVLFLFYIFFIFYATFHQSLQMFSVRDVRKQHRLSSEQLKKTPGHCK